MKCRCPTHAGGPRATFQVSVVIPLSGPAGIFGPSCEAVTQLAVQQLNAAGGILGRHVEVRIIDGGKPAPLLARTLSSMIAAGEVDAVTGWHISRVRQHLAAVIGPHVPYVYTSLYEGAKQVPGLFCSGEIPADQIRPAMEWMKSNSGLRSLYIVGDNYVWPRESSRLARQYAHELEVSVSGTSFVPLGTSDFRGTLDDVVRSGADTVLMLLVGQDAVSFNRAFAARGLQDTVHRLSPLMEENMLLGSGSDATLDLFVTAGYFGSLATTAALELLGDYVALHGTQAPPLNNAAESCYEGFIALAALTEAAGSARPHELMAKAGHVAYEGPRGVMSMVGNQVRQHVYLARANGADFDILQRI